MPVGIVSEDQIIEEFKKFGEETLSSNVLDKLYEISRSSNVSANELLNEWLAFSLSNGQASLNDETIVQFEAWRPSQASKRHKTPKTPTSSKTKFRSIDTLDDTLNDSFKSDSTLLGAYCTPSAKDHLKRSPQTPQEQITANVNKKFASLEKTPKLPFSPTTFSPQVFSSLSQPPPSQQQRYSGRSNAGEIVLQYPPDHSDLEATVWSSSSQQQVQLSHTSCNQRDHQLLTPYKYMFQKLTDKAAVLNEMIDDVDDILSKHHKVSFKGPISDDEDQSNLVRVTGRVCSDSNGKINSTSALLETSAKYGRSVKLKLDVSQLENYSIFPGQVLGIEGNLVPAKGNELLVCKKIYDGVMEPVEKLSIAEPIQIVIAAGPFTTSDCLTYEPLADLCSYLHNHNVQLCILMGPFVDGKHELIMKGNISMTYEDLFMEQLSIIASCTVGMCTKFVVIASGRDAFHEPIYPTPPIQIDPEHPKGKLNTDHIHFMPDPCMLDVNGIHIALTSTDILFHLGMEEVSVSTSPGDRMHRLLSHVLTQHNFYPLFPPHQDVSVDYDHYQSYCNIVSTPHMFVCPSDLRNFIKDVNGCCCINPGKLSKGQIGGTFARVCINPGTHVSSLTKNVVAHVIRI